MYVSPQPEKSQLSWLIVSRNRQSTNRFLSQFLRLTFFLIEMRIVPAHHVQQVTAVCYCTLFVLAGRQLLGVYDGQVLPQKICQVSVVADQVHAGANGRLCPSVELDSRMIGPS